MGKMEDTETSREQKEVIHVEKSGSDKSHGKYQLREEGGGGRGGERGACYSSCKNDVPNINNQNETKQIKIYL